MIEILKPQKGIYSIVGNEGCVLCPEHKNWINTGNGGIQDCDLEYQEEDRLSDIQGWCLSESVMSGMKPTKFDTHPSTCHQ
jgi:hypothetical protein